MSEGKYYYMWYLNSNCGLVIYRFKYEEERDFDVKSYSDMDGMWSAGKIPAEVADGMYNEHTGRWTPTQSTTCDSFMFGRSCRRGAKNVRCDG